MSLPPLNWLSSQQLQGHLVKNLQTAGGPKTVLGGQPSLHQYNGQTHATEEETQTDS